MHIEAYTAVFDGYDTLKPSKFYPTCITDKIQDVRGWYWYEVKYNFRSPVLANRFYKFFPWEVFPRADVTIYFDGNIELTTSPQVIVDKYLGNKDIAVFEHPEGRNCIYQEAKAIVKRHKAKPGPVEAYIEELRSWGYPEHAGLAACYVLIRRNTAEMHRLGTAWWKMFNEGPKRDQLYFNYLCNEMGIEYNLIKGNLFKDTSIDFKRSRHVKC